MALFGMKKMTAMPTKDQAPVGRSTRMVLPGAHHVTGAPIEPPFADAGKQVELAMFGIGCFWGAERKFWETDGVISTVVGYAGGWTPNATYEEACSGLTGHNEVVLVAFDPTTVSYEQLLKVFWENHDPTQGMRQGNDVGTQYRSGIYVFTDDQRAAAESSLALFQEVLTTGRYGTITTEIVAAAPIEAGYNVAKNIEPSPTLAVFYPAEDYHQQYLSKNPNGYCGIGGTGMTCPIGVATVTP
jgi:peptide-methionine (S)-S-oxide reductase